MLTRPGGELSSWRVRCRSARATLGDVFTFCSGLYFRGKLTYARHFAASSPAVRIITPSRGLVPPDTLVGTRDLAEFAAGRGGFRRAALYRSAQSHLARTRRARTLTKSSFLGSVATGKYTRHLASRSSATRLLFPAEFAGRGDMSRGALLLRAISGRQGTQLRASASCPSVKAAKEARQRPW